MITDTKVSQLSKKSTYTLYSGLIETQIFYKYKFLLMSQSLSGYMWHFIGQGPIWLKWSYCQGRVVWAISEHLRPIPSPTVENSSRNRHLNLKNETRENFKMLRNCNFNIFSHKKAISSLCMWISGYDIIYNSSARTTDNFLRENMFVTPPDSSWKMRKIW